METLLPLLKFRTAVKKPLNYRKAIAPGVKALTYYIHDSPKPMPIVTKLKKEVETRNVAHQNDIVITGPLLETYVQSPSKFLQLYNVREEIAVPRDMPRSVAKVSMTDMKNAGIAAARLTFTTGWGESMLLLAGDYLVKEQSGTYYRIEKTMFEKTYRFSSAT